MDTAVRACGRMQDSPLRWAGLREHGILWVGQVQIRPYGERAWASMESCGWAKSRFAPTAGLCELQSM